MNETYIHDKYNIDLQKPTNSKFISFSQYSTFKKCPHYWKLCNIDKLKDKESTIHTIFGTAMHTTIQTWVKTLYLETVKKAEALDLNKILLDELKGLYMKETERMKVHFSTKEQLTEFYMDGIAILEYLKKKRNVYFSKKHEELIGIEIPIQITPDPSKPNVVLVGYLDAVVRDKRNGKFRILDFKTSTKGWTQWDKKDEVKTSQLLLYKMHFATQHNIPIDNIEVEYLILKRKIDIDSLYPQRRVQQFEPANGKISINKVQKSFQEFIDSCFLPDGSYNATFNFIPKTGNNNFNCRFCEFRDREDLCPKSKRK